MVRAVEALLEKRLYSSLLILIVCYLDAFANGDKRAYLQILTKHFPELVSKLPAEEFYQFYRNGMVHRMKPFKGYALAEDKDLEKGAYFGRLYLSKKTTGGKKEQYPNAINYGQVCKRLPSARTKQSWEGQA